MPNCHRNEPISVIVLCSPGLMRESLRTLFSAIPGVQICGMMDLAEVTPHTFAAQFPDCVVIKCPDVHPDDTTLALLGGLRQAGSQTRSLIISASPNQGSACLAAGADLVLVKGFALGELKQAFDMLFDGNSSERYR